MIEQHVISRYIASPHERVENRREKDRRGEERTEQERRGEKRTEQNQDRLELWRTFIIL